MIYDLADLRVNICNEYAYTDRFCGKYLSEDQDSPYDLTAAPDPEDFENEKKASEGFPIPYIENICIYRNDVDPGSHSYMDNLRLSYRGNSFDYIK